MIINKFIFKIFLSAQKSFLNFLRDWLNQICLYKVFQKGFPTIDLFWIGNPLQKLVYMGNLFVQIEKFEKFEKSV
jgi:hypothetical protein